MDYHTMDLSPSQKRVLSFVAQREGNLLVLGEPGTGKSFVLKALQDLLTARGLKHTTVAPRGAAAYLVGGETLHSKLVPFHRGAGILRDAAEMRATLKKALGGELGGGSSARAREREAFWKGLDVLFFDEVFLCDGGLFAITDHTARVCRNNDRPFGGIRLCCMGDPFQISPRGATFHPFRPVRVRHDDEGSGGEEAGSSFADEHTLHPWDEARMAVFELLENKRQESDLAFRELLGNLRRGSAVKDMPEAARALLLSRCVEQPPPGVVALYWSREDARNHNRTRNETVVGDTVALLTVSWLMGDGTPFPKRHDTEELRELARLRDDYVAKLPVEGEMAVKTGSSVMLLTNLDIRSGAYCGAVGTVLDVTRDKDAAITSLRLALNAGGEPVAIGPHVETITYGGVSCTVTHWQLGFGWAATYDSIQGKTLDAVACAVTPRLPPGMLYVGITRVRKAKDFYLFANVNRYNEISSVGRILCDCPEIFRPDPHVVAFMESLRTTSAHEVTDVDVFQALSDRPRQPNDGPRPSCMLCGGPPEIVLQPCAHLATCEDCWASARKDGARSCPECREIVRGIVKAALCSGRYGGSPA
jgi:hypothetical protein